MDNENAGAFLLVGIIVGGLIIGLITATMGGNHFRHKAIENNCAQYSSTTGAFEWIPKGAKP